MVVWFNCSFVSHSFEFVNDTCSLNLYFIFSQKYKFGGSLLEGLIIHPVHNESIFLIKTKHSKGMTPVESIKSQMQRLYDYCDFAKCHQDIWTGTLVVSRGRFRGGGEYRLGGWPLLFGGAKKNTIIIVNIKEKMKTNTLETEVPCCNRYNVPCGIC